VLIDKRIVVAVAGLMPALLFGLVFAFGAGPLAVGVVVAIWAGGFVSGYAFAELDVVDPLYAQTADALAQTKSALAERDQALERLHALEQRE
jgi:hypothetical protein